MVVPDTLTDRSWRISRRGLLVMTTPPRSIIGDSLPGQLPCLTVKRTADALENFDRLVRLQDVVTYPLARSFFLYFRIEVAARDDGFHVRIDALYLKERVPARKLWEADVGDDESDLAVFAPVHIDRLFPVPRRKYVIAVSFEEDCQRFEQNVFVFDEKNRLLARPVVFIRLDNRFDRRARPQEIGI